MSIQSLIDAAPPGGTVSVAPGTYNEQLVINKPLTLAGPDPSAGEAIVDAAGMAATPTLLITSGEVTVILLTFQNGPGQGIRVGTAGFPDLEEVLIENCTVRGHDLSGIMNINRSELTVTGSLIENNGAISSFERAGIFLRPHGLTSITSNTIRSNNGDGIYAEGSDTGLLIENNTIENESFSGITLAWDEQNVTIRNNTIHNCGLVTDELKGGVIIIQAAAEIITGNTIEDCKQRGIMWGWVPSTGPIPAGILISANRISNSTHDAIYLFSQGPGSFIPPDPYPLEPLISGNLLTENDNAGVFVSNNFQGSPSGNANPHLDCNSIQDNTWGAFNQTATVINAVNNWWGDSSGPYHPLLNPGGSGNPVSDNIDFIPWKERPPLPPPTERACIKTTKIYWRCRDFQVSGKTVDLSAAAKGEVYDAECLRVDLLTGERHPLPAKKIKGAGKVQVSFYYRCKIKFLDRSGWKVLTTPPLLYEKTFTVPPLVQDRRIDAAADIYLECPECFVSGRRQVTCCIAETVLVRLTSPVWLLVPTYGFCPEPDSCRLPEGACIPHLLLQGDA